MNPAEVVGSRPGARPEVPADTSAVGGMGESEGPSMDRLPGRFRWLVRLNPGCRPVNWPIAVIIDRSQVW